MTDSELLMKLWSTEASMIDALTGPLNISICRWESTWAGYNARMKALKTLTWTALKELCSDEIFQNELCASEEIVEG